jgi:hypothetical protein
MLPPSDGGDTDPMSHFIASVTDLFEYVLRNNMDSDMVGITIRNQVNVQDKAVRVSFGRKDQLTENGIWCVFEKVAQSNARFHALDQLIVEVHSVRMPVDFGGGVKTKGRTLSVMAHLNMSIVEVKAENNCLAHALIIAIAKVTNDPNYKAYIQGHKIRPVIDHLLETTGIDLKNGDGFPELTKFQEHFKEYRIVYGGLHYEDIVFDGQVESEKRLNLLFDDVTCHVITDVTGAMAKR